VDIYIHCSDIYIVLFGWFLLYKYHFTSNFRKHTMAEWWESTSSVRKLAGVMADEFKRAKVGCCEDTSTGSSGGGQTPQERFDEQQEKATKKLGIFGSAIKLLVNSPLKKLGQAIDVAFGDILRRAAHDLAADMKYGSDSVRFWREQMNAIDLGLPAAQLAELSAETRQSVLAMGGFETWVQRMDTANESYFGYIGDTGDTVKYLARQMQMFGEMGIKPSLDIMTQSTKTMGGTDKSLKEITSRMLALGVPLEKQIEMQRTILEDDHVQAKLRATNTSEERAGIVRNLMARQLEYRALGMSTEQALNASKALEAIGGKKPLDRYKQAAKATAALSAMGIEGAARVGDIIRMGQRATDADKEYARERLGMAEDVYAESKLLGRGYEFTVATLFEKGGFADLMGEGGLFSTKLKSNIAVTDEATESVRLFGDKLTTIAKVLTSTAMTYQEADNAMNKTIIGNMLGKGVKGAAMVGATEAAMRGMGAEGAAKKDELVAKFDKLGDGMADMARSLGAGELMDSVSKIMGAGAGVKGSVDSFHRDMNKRLDTIAGSDSFKDKVATSQSLGKLIRGTNQTAEERVKSEEERSERMLAANKGTQASVERLSEIMAESARVMKEQVTLAQQSNEINKTNAANSELTAKNTKPVFQAAMKGQTPAN
jgi:hypothetical protein